MNNWFFVTNKTLSLYRDGVFYLLLELNHSLPTTESCVLCVRRSAKRLSVLMLMSWYLILHCAVCYALGAVLKVLILDT